MQTSMCWNECDESVSGIALVDVVDVVYIVDGLDVVDVVDGLDPRVAS